ncbi:hypothetical protein MD588_05460 [Photobacterium sp. SDRW27]|uniref:lipopolysaccharide biosynthesis protein n=1 Tax=Photobacterium obscurum TaxID=2829490 RepID=UPI0022437163|nr:hypothetical protein [Photobacterium obscurum]MCW8328251.1 hypothetical protein [Photobacterium obscurum]
MIRSLLNSVVFSKIVTAASQFLIVMLVQFYLPKEETNYIYQLLSWSAIIVAMISFGANAALSKFLRDHNGDRSLRFAVFLLIKKVVLINIICFIGYRLNIFTELDFEQLMFISLCASLNFVDYISESDGYKTVRFISILKISVYIPAFVIKWYLLSIDSHYFYYSLYIEWLVVFLVMLFNPQSSLHWKGKWLCNYEDVKVLWSFLTTSSWVWLSGIIQLSWTRGSFIILSSQIGLASANTYFIFIRVIEAFSFVPNAISMRYFSKVLACEKSKVERLKKQYINDMVKISSLISFAVLILTWAYVGIYLKLSTDYTLYLISMLSSFFFMLRISLSREIVLNGKLHWSLISYLSAFLFAYLAYVLISPEGIIGALVCYLIYVLTSFFSPVICGWNTFKEYRKCLNLRLN